MNSRALRTVVLVLALAGGAMSATADVVFSSLTVAPTQYSQGGIAEMASDITLSGGARQLQSIEIGLSSPTGDRHIQARIYAADGPGGSPSTLLWASQWMQQPSGGDLVVLQFAVGGFVAPDHFIVSIGDDLPQGYAGMGVYHAPVSVGSAGSNWYRFDGGDWTLNSVMPVPMQIRLTAIPEPVSLAMLALGGLAVLRRRAR